MTEQTRITPADFFCNAAAQEAGFSGQFWLDAYNLYLDAVESDPTPSFDKWEIERTVLVPFRGSRVEVLVRDQPDGREYSVLRLTAFPAGEGSEPRRIDRWYLLGAGGEETPAPLGEAVLPDYIHRW